MNTDEKPVVSRFAGKHDQLTETIIGVFYDVYNELGGGFLESVYREALRISFLQNGVGAAVEVPVPVYFRGQPVGNFRADMLVEDTVLLELKAVSSLDRSHEGQILNYLRATEVEVGLLLNFGPRPQIKRFILENDRKKIRVHP
ncbi:MAG: GxxExxY protein [Acidobacteriaceae bacterium]